MALERLQKIIAAAGITSRRKAEELIQAGLVSVNGNIVIELGSKADPETDSIRVNNKLLKGAQRHEYVVLNKPRGYVTTVSDPEGRPTVMELVRSNARLYPVGRLDFNSEGLLLLTNDGELTHKLMKAASHIPKTYLVKVAGLPAEDQLRRLRSGVSITAEHDPKKRVRTARADIRVIKEAENPWLEVTLHEGRNRQIRKMFEEIGHHVEKIRRVRYGPLELDVRPGESRILTATEVARLEQATNRQPQWRAPSKPSKDGFGERGGTRQGGSFERASPKAVDQPRPPRREGTSKFQRRDRPAEWRPPRRGKFSSGQNSEQQFRKRNWPTTSPNKQSRHSGKARPDRHPRHPSS